MEQGGQRGQLKPVPVCGQVGGVQNGAGERWLGTEESNPHVQIQNLLSYH